MPTHHRTCCLCDALCRLRIEVEDGVVQRIAGEPDDPWSQGHICPKAVALQDLQEDPDRLRTPVRRTEAGGWEPISWDDALDLAAERLAGIRRAHGKHAVGVYVGNPNIHHYSNLFALVVLFEQLGTRARFTAQSVDNLPHAFAGYHVFGHPMLTGISDVDRTDHLVILGANPWVSNGGGMASGNVRKRIRGVQERGGRVVVIDPRRTETAEIADAHHAIVPGTDALLLLGMIQVLFAEQLATAPPAWCDGAQEIAALARDFPPERVAAATGLSADTIRTLARELAQAPSATVYARMGICTQAHGGLAAWLHVVIHALTGNLDRPGGLMFARPAVDTMALMSRFGARGNHTPGATRASGLPAFNDELPVAALAEEIETPGEHQIRGMITVAGNPVSSAPNGPRVERALASLDFHVAVDLYLNETSRTADLVLPAAAPLERDHFPLGMGSIAVRTVAEHSRRLFAPEGGRDDFDILTELSKRLAWKERALHWVAVIGLARALGPRRILDLLLKTGPFGRWRGGPLDLARLDASPLTLDLGPLEPVMPGRLQTKDGRAHLAPAPMVADLARLARDLDAGAFAQPLVLIGRRTLRSNNSWMHNSHRLVKGKPRCTLWVHPRDAGARELETGQRVRLSSRIGEVTVLMEITDRVRPGVVSLPHGWGQDRDGVQLTVARAAEGVSVNDLTDDALADRLSGVASFQGVPVRLEPVDVPQAR